MGQKKLGKWVRFWHSPYQNCVIQQFQAFFIGITLVDFDSFFKTFLTNRDKNEDENEKTWENESDI